MANAAALALHNVELNAQLQRSLANERQARERAEAANKLKDEFLATLSHELRTPLHVIRNWVWQLKRAHAPPLIEKALDVIERNAALQSRLIEDLLDVSRATTGQLRLEHQLVDLTAACTAVVEVLGPSVRAKQLHIELEQDRSCYIWGDADRKKRPEPIC